MAALKFVDSHNMVAFLEKPDGSDDFHQISDFLNASHIRYALTENPIIYVSHIEQFWSTAKIKTLNNGEQEIHVKVDGKTRVITEASIRRHLKLIDENELFPTMLLQNQQTMGEGSLIPIETYHTPTFAQSSSQPPITQIYRRGNRQDTDIPQYSVPTIMHIADKAAFTGVDDKHGGAATTGTDLDAGQGSGNIHKTPSISYDSPPRGDTLEGDEDSMKLSLQELMDTCTLLKRSIQGLEKKSQEQASEILNLKEVTTSQAAEIIGLKNRVKK
ncbi:hypothetical protein Tco_0514450 [Tanacetum coccineum]